MRPDDCNTFFRGRVAALCRISVRLKYPIGQRIFSAFVSSNTQFIWWPEASVSIKNSCCGCGRFNILALVIALISFSKESNCSFERLSNVPGDPFRSLSFSKLAMRASLWTKWRWALHNLKKEQSSGLLRRGKASFVAFFAEYSTSSFFCYTTCPKYVTVVRKNSHLGKHHDIWALPKMRRVLAPRRSCLFTEFEKTVAPSG